MPRYVQPASSTDPEAVSVIDVLGLNPLRAGILRYLAQNPEGGTSGDIGRALDAGYKTVHWHLRRLEQGGLVDSDGINADRQGQRVIYKLNHRGLDTAVDEAAKYLKGK